jgi:hypothetical protein
MSKRNGDMIKRNDPSRRRTLKLGYYIIYVDTQETEQNYINGFRDSIPDNLKNNIVIKVQKVNTANLLSDAIYEASLEQQYREVWIILDRDEFKNFDKTIVEATNKKVKVGWSNPCIETWFHAHFENSPNITNSQLCISKFRLIYENNIAQEYKKNDKDIYKKLQKYGDETNAIKNMKTKKKSYHEKKGRLSRQVQRKVRKS